MPKMAKPQPIRSGPDTFADDWETFVEDVAAEIQAAIALGGPGKPTTARKRQKKSQSADGTSTTTEYIEEMPQNTYNLPPYHHPSSIIKRMAYGFVRKHRGRGLDWRIEKSIANYMESEHSVRKNEIKTGRRRFKYQYEQRPFYFVLLGLHQRIYSGGFSIEKPDVTKFSQLLEYADRHNVPPKYLIGFLYQSGTSNQLRKKLKDPNTKEDVTLRRR